MGRIRKRIGVVVSIMVIVGGALLPLTPVGNHGPTAALALEDAGDSPFLLWNEIDPEAEQAGGFIQIYRDAALAPTILRLNQWNTREEGWTDRSYAATYYELRSSALADRLAREFTQKLPHPLVTEKDGVLTAYGRGDKKEQTVIVCYQTRVLHVVYHGDQDLYPFLPRYEENVLTVKKA